jgi:hypothetical protein
VTQNRGIEFGQADANADIWFAMMGDPTLRMHIIKPPTNVRTDGANVLWDASTDPSVESYNIYRAPFGHSPGTIAFERIGAVTAAIDSFRDPVGSTEGYQYMVRAVKREDGPSGSYYNLSQGAFSHGVSVSAGANASGSQSVKPAHAAGIAASEEALDWAFAGAQVQRDFSHLDSGEFDVTLISDAIDAAIDDELLAATAITGVERSPIPNFDAFDRPGSTRRDASSFLTDDLTIDFESLSDDAIDSAANALHGR